MLHFSRLLLQLYLIIEVLGLPYTQKNIGLSNGVNYGLNIGASNLAAVKFYDSQTQKDRNKRDINHLTHDSLKRGDLGESCYTSFSCTYRNAECVNSECRCPSGTRPSILNKACETSAVQPHDWDIGAPCGYYSKCGLFMDCISGRCKCTSGFYPDYVKRKCEVESTPATLDEKLIVLGVVGAVVLVAVLFFVIKSKKFSGQCKSPNPSSYNQRTGTNNFSRLTPLSSANNTPQVSRSFASTSSAVPPMTYCTGNKVEEQLPSYDEATKPTTSAPSGPTLKY